MAEKEDLKLAACTYFIDSYNQSHRRNLKLVEQRDKPEYVLHDDATGAQVGVEVAHLVYDEKDAEIALGPQFNELHGIKNSAKLVGGLC